MPIVLDGTSGINTPDLVSAGPISGTTGTFSGAVQASGVTTNLYPLVSATAVASTSGTSIDFTGIPSWVRRVTVMFSGVSTNGTSFPQSQIGSGSVTTSGYVGGYSRGTSAASPTSGLVVQASAAAASLYYGVLTWTNISGNTWVGSGNTITNASDAATLSNCSIALSGTLDRVRITTVNGTDTFDAGSINIMYE